MALCNIRYNATVFNPMPIWIALQQRARDLQVDPNTIATALGPTAIAIDTRARILRAVVGEARSRVAHLLDSISDSELEQRMAKSSDDLVYGVLRSIDAFFFESLSLYELLQRFYVAVLRRVKIETGQAPRGRFQELVLEAETQVGFPWRAYLEENRDLYVHETAPYLAVEFDAETLKERRLVIESEPGLYLGIPDFDNVLKGLSLLLDKCRNDLTNRISQTAGKGTQ